MKTDLTPDPPENRPCCKPGHHHQQPHWRDHHRNHECWERVLVGACIGLLSLAVFSGQDACVAAELQIQLPLGRTAYQTNERIDLTVVRSDAAALKGNDLTLTLTGENGSRLAFKFPAPAIALQGQDARGSFHLHANGWLLRPGQYAIEVAFDGAVAKTNIEVFSHIRKSSFKLIDWGSQAKGDSQLVMGEDGMGFNLLFAAGNGNDSIAGGVDYMGSCVMSGGHQMDLRMECDWSDPAVISGGTSRVVRAALQYRTNPNAIGVHLYDEPGLTWHKHPVTGEFTPHGLPTQIRAYKAAFGENAPEYHEVNAADAQQAAKWKQWARFKLGFMDAAWKDAQFGISATRPDFLSVTQSQYGFSAFTDGYYFNVARSLPVVSGHGGYDDYGPGFFNPSYFLEMGRARDYHKPAWYLPTWYGNTPAERYRLEQNLSFMTNIQGMAKPPEMAVHNPDSAIAAEAIVETNKCMARLGTIFTTMPVTRPPVAMLMSMSQFLQDQTANRKLTYLHEEAQGINLPFTYLAGKLIQQPFLAIVDEDILDGTLQNQHEAVVLTSISYLDPEVVAGLEDFAAQGGLVLLTGDSTVKIHGAILLGATPGFPDAEIIKKLMDEKKYGELAPYTTVAKYIQGAQPLAAAIKAQLDKAGIRPVFDCNQPGIVASRQVAGDIEYLFAVNATPDAAKAKADKNAIQATVATISLPFGIAGENAELGKLPANSRDGFQTAPGPQPVYDAVHGGPYEGFSKQGNALAGEFRFGPGQMRVFARTARPIGGVQVQTPTVVRDFTAAESPVRLNLSAALMDVQRRVLAGSAPLLIRVVDPLGVTRFELYRATEQGVCRLSLPLAANDPAGEWKVSVRELLSNQETTNTFRYRAAAQCGVLAGATPRAVIFGNDRENLFRFFRNHKAVTIVKGTGPDVAAAAEQLAEALRPWEVRATIVNAAEVNRPRELSELESKTFIGIDYAPTGAIKPGRANPAELVGYDLPGPAVLLGTPEDNPLIATLAKFKVLPYTPSQDFPGRGRGMLAWQLDILGHDIETVCVIAADAAGFKEGIGTLYEAAAGMDPLTPLILPAASSITAAHQAPSLVAEPNLAWSVTLPDRAGWVIAGEQGQTRVYSLDGSLTTLDAAGKTLSQTVATPAEVSGGPKPAKDLGAIPKEKLLRHRIVKRVATTDALTAVAYWGGAVQIFDAKGTLKGQRLFPQDVAALTWSNGKAVVALADGSVVAITAP